MAIFLVALRETEPLAPYQTPDIHHHTISQFPMRPTDSYHLLENSAAQLALTCSAMKCPRTFSLFRNFFYKSSTQPIWPRTNGAGTQSLYGRRGGLQVYCFFILGILSTVWKVTCSYLLGFSWRGVISWSGNHLRCSASSSSSHLKDRLSRPSGICDWT